MSTSCNKRNWSGPIFVAAALTMLGARQLPAQTTHPAAAPPDAPGKALYVKWCSGCHGDAGQGDGFAAPFMMPRPRDLTLGNFYIRSTKSGDVPTDADIRRTIAEGLPGTAMSGWKTALSPKAIDTLVAYVKAFSPFFSAAPASIAMGSEPARGGEGPAEGRKIYQQLKCFECHGAAGRGDGTSVPTLEDDQKMPIRATDLTKNWSFRGGPDVVDIYRGFRTGLNGTPMPAYTAEANGVNDEQLWRLAEYVRSLSPAQRKPVRLGAVILVVALLFGCGTTVDKQLPREAAVAMTGSPATLNDISRVLMIEGTGENFNFGQNLSPDAELPKFTVTNYQRVMEFGRGRWRQDLTRVPNYITANTAPQRQITAVDGAVAFNVNPDGTAVRQPDQIAKDRRAELYHHPLGFLNAVFTERGTVSNTRKEGNFEAVDLTVDGTTYTMYVDPTTKLPARITSPIYNVNLGDVIMETSFANYMDVQGHKMPGRITTKIDKWVISDITAKQQSLSGAFGNLAAPDDVKKAGAVSTAAKVTVEEVSKGVWYLAGQTHHSVLVEFADHLTLIEAPQNEERTLAVIQKARELVPNKPLKYLVSTHHHFDHSGGIRAAVSEGLTIVTQEANKAFYEDVVSRKHTIIPDALSKNPRPLMIETVTDKLVLKDAAHTLELYHVAGNPHASAMLMAYLPAERLLVEADLYTPPAQNAPAPPGYPFAPNLLDNIQKNGLAVARLLPIHGFIVPFANLQAAVTMEQTRARLTTTD